MKLHALSLSLFLSMSPLLASDYLTIEQQNEEMNRAFNTKEKPIHINSLQVQNALREFAKPTEFTKQIFPHQNLTSNNSSSVMTLDSWEQTKKNAAETMFHRLNDALNFVLTNREILLSAISKNPELIGLTCYTVGKDTEDKSYFDFHLPLAPHPIAYLAQGYLTLKEHQYWIDILLLFRNTAFPNHTLSSYDHNAASAIKDLLQGQIDILEGEINSHPTNSINLAQIIDQTDYQDVSFFVKADHSFHDLLRGCLKRIDDALPAGTITEIKLHTAGHLKNKGHVVDFGKNKRELVYKNLSPRIGTLHTYFSKNYTAILGRIRSMGAIEYITTHYTSEEVNILLQTPFYANAFREHKQLLQGNFGYDRLFSGLTKNMTAVQQIRKELGLPKEIFKGLDFEKEMYKALKSYQLEKMASLMEQLQNQQTEVNTEIKKEAEVKSLPSNQEKIRAEEEGDQKTNQSPKQMDLLTIQEPEHLPNISNNADKDKESEEEDFIFDSCYFKLIHQYHQNQKSQNITKKSSMKKLSGYEKNLYLYLMDNIFRPKHREPWGNLVSGLATFGFKGKPNTLGNGSTWEFAVTEKNELFFTNPDYKGATFNVHEFKGNEPINPKYLKFFQSGFSNVFGLTEEYIAEALAF